MLDLSASLMQDARIDLNFVQEHEQEIGPIMSKGRSLR